MALTEDRLDSVDGACLAGWADAQENAMNAKTEGTFAIAASLIVLFSAMWDPRISVAVSIVGLVAFAVYRFAQKDK